MESSTTPSPSPSAPPSISNTSTSTIKSSNIKNNDVTPHPKTTQDQKPGPPSHILPDGEFVYLPPKTPLERGSFFARSVAKHELIIAEQSQGADSIEATKNTNDNNTTETQNDNDNDNTPQIHPILIASARLRASGIDELSKTINLGTLLSQDEYIGLKNIVRASSAAAPGNAPSSASTNPNTLKTAPEPVSNPVTAVTGDKTNLDTSSPPKTSKTTSSHPEADSETDLRASYVLKRKHAQFSTAHASLSRFRRRLEVVTTARRVVDRRLLQLRRRWRLAAPEHGSRVVGPVRPEEVVAVDVEVYGRDRTGRGRNHSEGKIARLVPRYATIELSDGYDIKKDLERSRKLLEAEERKITNGTDVVMEDVSQENDNDGSDQSQEFKTRAEPFAIADPTLGAIDLDFDPNKVPVLSLLFQIEKSSTEFVQTVSLSSSNGNKTNNTPPDEQVIQSLQHSLFCAKLFDSIRQEISQGHGTNPTNATTIKPRQIVWLSSEMEESFLPPPSVMVGGGDNEGLYSDSNVGFRSSPLCVVHCHEGELKVQLDAEYALTVKLVDDEQVKTATRSDGSNSTNNHKEEEEKATSVDSGSRTPEQLHALCRMLLLHAQFVYHDHCTKQQEEEEAASRERETENGSGTNGRRQALSGRYGQRSNGGGGPGGQTSLNGGGRKRVRLSPHILQSCVNLGAKSLFECKVRNALKRFSKWLKRNHPSLIVSVQWLPLAFFDSHSQFALSIGSTFCIDVAIDGYQMNVSGFSSEGGYRSVDFTSAEEFELYLQMETVRNFVNG